MIDGLKVTLTGEKLRALLDDRIASHERSAERWTHEQERTPEDETEDEPLLPDEMCANEAERHEWRIAVLEFIRDHIDPLEVYLLGAADLEFGELLPAKPGCVELDEYKQRTGIAFNLERLTREMGYLPSALARIADAHAGGR